jgi:hypothetical protein
MMYCGGFGEERTRGGCGYHVHATPCRGAHRAFFFLFLEKEKMKQKRKNRCMRETTPVGGG